MSYNECPENRFEGVRGDEEKNFEERLNFIELYAKWLKENRIKIEKVEE